MSAATAILRLRAALTELLPYVAHRPGCARPATGGACTCGAAEAVAHALRVGRTDPARTGAPR